ncbi:predicted protein [Chaetomium globosum CBS 148.51]|uniref:2EXR domain-containing protein n=1 Tax=Chaetomium globosum (strain ATCC 6205 / CBS 148.51 / DSM 1962 / NBRC 6347 / NRRL 1970) TaxID=306901 RepID=Q2GNH4_CHAGB|nr:uncharacterized protein CHGG_10480 [Chaetomium globosum CBS 148.51]EAQ84076.1 predicted protein [Chaetomium globosum CBS 148.51]
MAARDFPRFMDLPGELRLQIWSYCLPGPRVVEMDFTLSYHQLTVPVGCHRELWSSHAGHYPVMSRAVARERFQYATNGTQGPHYSPMDPLLDAPPVRLRKGFDILHLNWHYGYKGVDVFWPPKHLWKTFEWLAGQAAAVSVSADLLLPFEPKQVYANPYITSLHERNVKRFKPDRLHYVVLANVEIHITAREAAQAAVIGDLGEEPIQLVDPRDTAAITKFRDVWKRHQPEPPFAEERDVAKFFSAVIEGAADYCARVEKWRQNMEKTWLLHKCRKFDLPLEDYKDIWPHWWEGGNETFLPHPGLVRDWDDKALQFAREHPWVQDKLALMPRFEPVIMFRHCVGWCGPMGCANRSLLSRCKTGVTRRNHIRGVHRNIVIWRAKQRGEIDCSLPPVPAQ